MEGKEDEVEVKGYCKDGGKEGNKGMGKVK